MKIEILLETCVKKVNICVICEDTGELEGKPGRKIRVNPELKNEFYNWMLKRISEETAKKYVRLIGNISLTELREQYDRVTDKRNFAKAIRKFLNYLNETGRLSDRELASLKKQVPIPKTNADNNVPSDDDIREAFCYFSMMRKDLYTVAKLLLYSGARARHVVNMINNFSEKNLLKVNDFARYNLNIDNNTKKAYCIYFPAELVNDLRNVKVTMNSVRCDLNYVASSRRTVSAKYIRKWFNNLLVRMKVDKDVRNFILSRSSEIHKSVEAEHYLELVALADEVYPEIMREIKKRIRV